MLQALLKNKTRSTNTEDSNTEKEKNNLIDLFKCNEDTATSFVFGHLRHLPPSLFLKIINMACDLSINIESKIEEFNFWPRWKKKKKDNKENPIEPDVFIRLEAFDVIVEVKNTKDTNNQNEEQWENQIEAYGHKYVADNKELYYIALGGNKDDSIKKVKGIDIYPCGWDDLLRAIRKEEKGAKETNIKFILNDLIEIFRVFELEHFWLESMPQVKFENNISLIEDFK